MSKIIKIQKKVVSKNDLLAAKLKKKFKKNQVFVVNIVGSPGAGKTEFLYKLMLELKKKYTPAAVTGDLATENDAQRLAKSGCLTKQILTGTMCHLEANLLEKAIAPWDLAKIDFLFIENIGNLVCPSGFDLAENLRIMLISSTEGEDKPLKYPTLTKSADVVIINKIDLAKAVECDLKLMEKNITKTNSQAKIFKISAKKNLNFPQFINFLIKEFDKENA